MARKPNERLIGVCTECGLELEDKIVDALWRGGDFSIQPQCTNCKKGRFQARYRKIDFATLNVLGTRPAD